MIVTARVAKWLHALPDDDATAVLDTVTSVAANPDASSRHCKKLSANLWEARIQRPHRTNYRVMFAFRPDGQLVVLSGCMKKSTADHQREINRARVALTSPTQEIAMAHNPPIFSGLLGWIYASDGRQYRVRHMTRKKVLIETAAGPVTLNRSRLEQTGSDVVDGTVYKTTRYWLPSEAQELAS